MTGRFIGKTYKEYQSKFIEHFQYGKQIDDFLDMPKRKKTSTGPKTHVSVLEYEKSGNQIPNIDNFENLEKDLKFAHAIYVQNGSDAFPNEFMRFRNEAKPIWDKIQKHCKNAVTI